MSEVHALGWHADAPRKRCPECRAAAKSRARTTIPLDSRDCDRDHAVTELCDSCRNAEVK